MSDEASEVLSAIGAAIIEYKERQLPRPVPTVFVPQHVLDTYGAEAIQRHVNRYRWRIEVISEWGAEGTLFTPEETA